MTSSKTVEKLTVEPIVTVSEEPYQEPVHNAPVYIPPVIDSDVVIEEEIKKIEVEQFTGWNDLTYKKMEYLVTQGMDHIFASIVIDKCKVSKNPGWCVELVAHVRTHESGRCTSNACINYNNPFGLMRAGKHMYFDTKVDALDRWLQSYNKFWFNSNCTRMITHSRYSATQTKERIYNCEWKQSKLRSL